MVLNGTLVLQAAGVISIMLEEDSALAQGPMSGQLPVWDDVMTRWHGTKAKLVRRFADVGHIDGPGPQNNGNAVREGSSLMWRGERGL